MSRWQPMETAPKDGRQILIAFVNKGGPYAGQIAMVAVRWRDGRWCCGMMADGNIVFVKSPTNWMPLPDPPSPSGKE